MSAAILSRVAANHILLESGAGFCFLCSMRPQAILMIGPTGAGKSPLGDWLQTHGLWARACHHFDFGSSLRQIAAGATAGFSKEEIRYICDVVEKGILLENETFYLAIRILENFRQERAVKPQDLLLMNGLPRHLGQAEALIGYVEFLAVFHLQCSPETVWQRLQRNSGGDRTERTDDTREMVAHKLDIFLRRTAPLLDFYRKSGVPVIALPVQPDTQPPELIPLLQLP